MCKYLRLSGDLRLGMLSVVNLAHVLLPLLCTVYYCHPVITTAVPLCHCHCTALCIIITLSLPLHCIVSSNHCAISSALHLYKYHSPWCLAIILMI
jgi:hypothetical protein